MNIIDKIKGLFAVRTVFNSLKEAYMGSNHSWFSTRFWLTATTTAATFWGTVHGFIPQPYATYIQVSAVGFYVVVETIRKVMSDIQAAKIANGPTPVTTTVTTTQPVTTVTTPG